MKKIIFAMLFLTGISLASASSSLGLSILPKGKILGTIKLNHNHSNSGYYKITLDLTIADNHSQVHYSSSMKGAYSSYFNKIYIEDRGSDSKIDTITSVNAEITFHTCTDKSFSSCSIIKQQNLQIDYSDNVFTGIFPNSFDITV